MAAKKFKYIENICITKISAHSLRPGQKLMRTSDSLADKASQMNTIGDVLSQPEDCFLHDAKNKYFRCCKMILLMFHRVKDN